MKIRTILFSAVLACISVSYGCSSPFSELQSAKLVEKNHMEAAAHYSAVSFFNEGETEKLQDHIGLQFAFGISDGINLRFRYERLSIGAFDPDVDFNVWSFGPKFRLVDDKYALYLPFGFATGEDVESQETWEFHPTLLQTIEMNDNLEINISLKYLVRFNEDADNAFAFNLGLGIGSDLARLVFRPETGILIDPGNDGFFWHWSVGVTVFR